MRSASGLATTSQEQWSYVDTTETYIKWCKSNRVEPSTETLSDGTRAHWIGNRNANTVLLYFHGGGFNATGRPEYLDFLSSALESLNQHSDSPRLAALFLAYDVAPYSTYPTQLRQAALLLTHVLQTLHFRPSHILLGGDSAGANLTLALLGHILHPHPDPTIPRIELSEGRH
ncbi:hypothetical protein H2199_002981 [Coniosporium tulheliwenetii]|uniref:Uncharacterized protein n=1 Tax=Coniosporium tulheliwenetii TaxID=3383036 RepID=A0ACC2ZDQ4_9PEZI|nr:hypothetical protein H2199_002981 [Cladosporium sp. JES 115]